MGTDTSIAIDSADKVHISYYDRSNSDLKYATNASGLWVTTTVDSAGSVGWETSIAIDSSNKVHISYYDGTNGALKYATNEIPTAVTLSSFNAKQKDRKVVITWQTATEIDNLGFNILRSDSENGDYSKINKKLIPAKGSATKGASYKFVDGKVKSGKTYFYKLEDIDRYSGSNLNGPVSVEVSFKKKGKGKK